MSLGGGGLFGSGGYYGGGGNYGPGGHFGAYPACGCGSVLMILAGVLLVFGGCAQMFHM